MVLAERKPETVKCYQFTGSWNKEMKQLFAAHPNRFIRTMDGRKIWCILANNNGSFGGVPLKVYASWWIVLRKPVDESELDPTIEVYPDNIFRKMFNVASLQRKGNKVGG